MRADDLSLYHYEGCMYCGRVRRVLGELGVEVELTLLAVARLTDDGGFQTMEGVLSGDDHAQITMGAACRTAS